MKCYKCGQDMSEDDNFCGICGAENILKKCNELIKENKEIKRELHEKEERNYMINQNVQSEKEIFISREEQSYTQNENDKRKEYNYENIFKNQSNSNSGEKNAFNLAEFINKYYEMYLNNHVAKIVVYIVSFILIGLKVFVGTGGAVMAGLGISGFGGISIAIFFIGLVLAGFYMLKIYLSILIPMKFTNGNLKKQLFSADISIMFIVSSLLINLDFGFDFFGMLQRMVLGGVGTVIMAIFLFLIFNALVSLVFYFLNRNRMQKEMNVNSTLKFYLIRLGTVLIINIIVVLLLLLIGLALGNSIMNSLGNF